MADALPDQNIPQPAKDYEPELQALRSKVEHLERTMLSEAQVAQIAKNSVHIQAGQNCRVSGGNGQWTIDLQMPNATITVTGVCASTGYVISGTVNFAS